MDPVTIGAALSVAGSAFKALKAGFAVGRDIESMGKDLSRWMGAASDIDNAEKTTKNPSTLQKLFKGNQLEASAIEAIVAKKKMEKQRYEMKTFLNMTYGPNAWNEVLKMEGDIRKRRQKEIYDRQKFRQQILEYVGWVVLFITIVGFIVFVLFLLKNKYGW
jgi:hypothetical protein|tara:strand:- start:190 stop:675 length:486 start_codon:yes stop_codon:yes gene_type:complete